MVVDGRTRNAVNDKERATDGAPLRREVNYAAPSRSAQVRELLVRANLSQRAASKALEIEDRTMRYYCADDPDHPVPRVVILALERLVEMQKSLED